MATRNIKRAAGFTLAELAVVVIILGMILTVVVPRFGGISDEERLKTAARRVSGLALETYSEAAVKSRPFFLCLDLDERKMWLSTVRPGKEGFAGKESRFTGLPMDILVEDVFHPTFGEVKKGRVSFGYWPQGGSEPGTIHLTVRSEAEMQMTVFLRPYMGRTEIKSGYLTEIMR